MTETNFVLIHYSESVYKEEGLGRLQGKLRDPSNGLSEKGKVKIKEVADKLFSQFSEHKNVVIISSPLKRTVDAASIISDRLNLPVELDDRLMEACHGVFDGMTKLERQNDPKYKERRGIKDFNKHLEKQVKANQITQEEAEKVKKPVPPYGYGQNKDGIEYESSSLIQERVKEFFKDVSEKRPGSIFIVVSHGTPIKQACKLDTECGKVNKKFVEIAYNPSTQGVKVLSN